ncbi:ABC transporter permease [Leifsonia sp. RAF41]|uniref:ABC transporter permease n=1 Tax=Leifsonia sp. RAF41 TaxID=3233056 RepID=UPI003F9BF10E
MFTPLRWAALAFVLLLVILAVFAPLIIATNPVNQDIANRLLAPGSPGHLLGTDEYGRDVLSRLVYGARVELLVAFGATTLAAIFGTLLGLLGGYFGGVFEFFTMRLTTDVLLAFPPVILALLIVTIYGPGAVTLIAVMGILFAPKFARIVYGQTLIVKRLEYVDAAKAFGARTPTALFRVVLPNISAPIVVQFSLVMAAAILLESGLSFLGLGIIPPAPSWGGMVASGQRYMGTDPSTILIPSIVVVLTILSFGLLADALRDLLDPRARKATHG